MGETAIRFEVETKTLLLQGRPIQLTNRTPIFAPGQRDKRKLEIERRLYRAVSEHRANAAAEE